MSYQVLARKWRPQKFADMIGQEHVLRALINALDSGRLHHAYLFTGMRGVGKTTIARVLAKCLNCQTNGVSSTPCGECSACRDIEAGRFFDLIEVDAASRTKVDETRELLENVPYAPASGRYKVYLIDEVHMFSTHSFNALLKTLEEPPEHVKFLLATTDPQKVPVTVLSRCLQFNLKRMPAGRLADYLASILDEEGMSHERAALELIARASEGSVRDALSLVEQATAYGEGSVRIADTETMLGRVSTVRLLELLEALTAGDAVAVFAQVDSMAEYAPDYHELLGELLSVMHRLSMAQVLPASLTDEQADAERWRGLSLAVDAEALQLYYQIASHARRDITLAPDPREAFDMALLRMLSFAPQGAGASVTPAAPPAPAPATAKDKAPAADPERRSAPAADPERRSAPDVAPAAVGPVPESPAPPTRVGAGAATVPLVPERWAEYIEAAGLTGMLRELAWHCVLAEVSTSRVVLHLEQVHDHLDTSGQRAALARALGACQGQAIDLQVQRVGERTLSSPARLQAQRELAAMQAARESIEHDPLVQQLLARVDGTLDERSVRPLDKP